MECQTWQNAEYVKSRGRGSAGDGDIHGPQNEACDRFESAWGAAPTLALLGPHSRSTLFCADRGNSGPSRCRAFVNNARPILQTSQTAEVCLSSALVRAPFRPRITLPPAAVGSRRVVRKRAGGLGAIHTRPTYARRHQRRSGQGVRAQNSPSRREPLNLGERLHCAYGQGPRPSD